MISKAVRTLAFSLALLGWHAGALSAMGMVEWPRSDAAGPITVFFPSVAAEQGVRRGEFQMQLAVDAAPVRGNGALVVISHGSTAAPWDYLDIARALVDAGFVVAMPEHYKDNEDDASEPGPASWIRRPLEVSKAIDAMARSHCLPRCFSSTAWACMACLPVGTPRSHWRVGVGPRPGSSSIARPT